MTKEQQISELKQALKDMTTECERLQRLPSVSFTTEYTSEDGEVRTVTHTIYPHPDSDLGLWQKIECTKLIVSLKNPVTSVKSVRGDSPIIEDIPGFEIPDDRFAQLGGVEIAPLPPEQRPPDRQQKRPTTDYDAWSQKQIQTYVGKYDPICRSAPLDVRYGNPGSSDYIGCMGFAKRKMTPEEREEEKRRHMKPISLTLKA